MTGSLCAHSFACKRKATIHGGRHSLTFVWEYIISINLLFSTVIHMMAPSTPFTIHVVVLIIKILSCCSAENVYCVTPTATSCSSCPHNSTNCTTLSEYAQEAEQYFTSNTTMVFLPGDHVLDRNITVANVTRLTMRGESSSNNIATIVRNRSVGFSFTNMVDFNIYSLAFTSYNRSWSYGSHPASSFALFLQSTQNAQLVNCSFHDNLGTALTVHNTNIILAGKSEFIHNQCACKSFSEVGGLGCGITALNSNLIFTGNTSFLENNQTIPYLDYCAGAIWASTSSLYFNGTNNFTANSANNGGAIYVTNTLFSLNGTSTFSYNSADYDGGAIYAESNTSLSFTGTSNFCHNSAEFFGGAILAFNNTILNFSGTNNFINNSGLEGGAMYLSIRSTFSILPHTTVHWEDNHANLGGALFVFGVNPLIYCSQVIPREECFFQLPGQNLSNGIDVKLVFKNNSADNGGSVLYGGAIDNCRLTGLDSYSSGEVFDMLVHIDDENDYNTTSNISSDPIHMCPCKNNLPDCSTYPQLVYPGETFEISVVGVGQRDGTVSSTVRSTAITNSMESRSPNLLDYQYLQQANNSCTKLNYTVFSLSQVVLLLLHPEGSPCSELLKLQFLVNLNQTCPPGFSISESARSCVCEPRLAQYTNQCNITNGLGQITRDSSQDFWVGYDNSSHDLILHPHCPFDYCVTNTTVFSLNNTDLQCAYNRSGLLCGHCKKNYSLVLGSFHCSKQCTNNYLALLIPFSLMGVALVFLLLVCKLTVATGTLSGLVFYANIVGPNWTIFLPAGSTDALSVFIAWLNLDFGIETCFYDGMDAYSKTWLQFVFPLYLWVLVGLIIFVSHFSQRFANILGSNPVSVLATLILLSYAKILRTLNTVIYITNLEYPTYNRRVWLYDANIDYLVGKHIPLFIVAVVVFLFLFLPYTLLLLFGQWLQAISHLRLFSWVNRLKPFMDSYHAPYKAKHRYWPGLLLVFRFVLIVAFAFNPHQDPNINLLAILLGAGILQLWAWASHGVYKNWCLDALEGSFTLNLIVLVGTNMYINITNGRNQVKRVVGYTSVSIAAITFIGILAYHIVQQLKHTKLWKKMPKLKLELKQLNTKQTEDNLNNLNNNPKVPDDAEFREPWLEVIQPTHSVV